MNIVVCVKEVPSPCLPFDVNPLTREVYDEEFTYIINPYDTVALEEAVRIRERLGGKVTAVTLGRDRAEVVLRQCLTMGADDAVLVEGAGDQLQDAFFRASVLAEAITREGCGYDVVLCGSQSIDNGGGATGSILAELLDLPIVTAVVGLDVSNDGKTALVTKRLAKGARQLMRCCLPAVFTVDLLLNEPRYPTLLDRKVSREKRIARLSCQSLRDGTKPRLTTCIGISRLPPKKVFVPTGNMSPMERIRLLTEGGKAKKSNNLVEGTPDQLAKAVLDFLATKGGFRFN